MVGGLTVGRILAVREMDRYTGLIDPLTRDSADAMIEGDGGV